MPCGRPCSPRAADELRTLGLDHPIDYRTEPFEEVARDMDAVVELVGSPENGERSLTSHAELAGVDSAVVDLFRVADGRTVEHRDSVESIAPEQEWVNTGKF